MFIPRIVYNGVTLLFVHPLMQWDYAYPSVGGRDESSAGVPASWSQRRDNAVDVTLRFDEWALPAVTAWLAWVFATSGTASAFAFRFDAGDAATEYTVYLIDPVPGKEWKPTRDTNAPWVMTLRVRLRTANGAPFLTPFFAS